MTSPPAPAPSRPAASAHLSWLAVAALSFNAFVWGVSWWPLRHLQGLGLHPLWATALIYGLSLGLILVRWPAALSQWLRTPALWLLALAAGSTNAAFNWGVTIGDVVRVVLLFYLMPLWSVVLARWLLHERLTRLALLRVVIALAGAFIVLKPEGQGWPLPRGLPDWLGLIGGFTFALNNVLLKRAAAHPPPARALAMFLGGALVSALLALGLGGAGLVPAPPAPQWDWLLPALGLGLAFLGANLALQYGAVRLRVSSTAVVMLTEVLYAAGSAVLLGGQHVTASLLFGGALIVSAAALAAFDRHEPT